MRLLIVEDDMKTAEALRTGLEGEGSPYNRDRGPVSVIGTQLHWEF